MNRWLRFLPVLLLLMLVPVGLAGVMLHQARAMPVVRRADLPMPGLPIDAQVRVALIADIHIGTLAMDAGRLERIVAQVNALHPDMVLIAGDLIEGNTPGSAARLAQRLVTPLSGLRSRLGTVAVLGNHDHDTGAAAVRAALIRAGVTVLENGAAVRGGIAIGGIGDDYSRHADIAGTMRAVRATGRPFVILTHSPDLVPDLPPDAHIVLAGHTHCGQAYLFGMRLSPEVSRRGDRYRCGLIRDGSRTVVVTAGLGTSGAPFRLGAPPDLWLLTLRPQPISAVSPPRP